MQEISVPHKKWKNSINRLEEIQMLEYVKTLN